MKHSIALRRAPTHRQAREILVRLRGELEARGAAVELTAFDALRFRMPAPWRAPRLAWLLAVTSGSASISAAGGGPWRVRYVLSFAMLRVVCLALSVALAYVGRGWPRLSLLNALVILWLTCYLLLSLISTARFSRLLRAAASNMIERRRRPRAEPRAPESQAQPGAPPAGGAAGVTTEIRTDGAGGNGADPHAQRPDVPRLDARRPEASRAETPHPDRSA